MFNLTHKQLKEAESSVYSQGGQDGVLEAIFNQIGEGDKIFCEFGARDGVELSNTANLRLNKGWTGLLMDVEPMAEIVKKQLVLAENINETLHRHKCINIDYMSIDIDGNDWWVWRSLKLSPAIITIEFNSKFGNEEDCIIEYNSNHKWEGDDYYGASLLALKKLGETKGYTLVHVVGNLDAVFVRNDLIHPDYIAPTMKELLPEPIIAFEKISNKRWVTK